MPMPTPRDGESRDDFMSRCMADEAMRDEFDDQDQRAAVCMTQWRDKAYGQALAKAQDKTFKDLEAMWVPGHVHRAYSVLNVKAVEADKRIIRGVATTPEPDRVGDIVEPLGVRFRNPMPLLLYHQHDKPVGHVSFRKPTKTGIEFEARLPALSEPGTLKDRVDEAWQSIKAGLIAGVSIGFRALEFAHMDTGGIRFVDTEVLELSLVTVPANAGATITEIRSIDTAQRAASGQERGRSVDVQPPASRDKPKPVTRKGNTMSQTIAEQISAYEATRAAKAARMADMMNKAAEDGVTLDADQTDEYDGLEREVEAIDKHLKRLGVLEAQNRASAKPANGGDTKTASASRSDVPVISMRPNVSKGTQFTRYVMALAAAKGNLTQAVEYAKSRWESSTPEVVEVLKAAVTAGTTTDSDWAAPLVVYQNMASEFVELLRPETIIGRINGLRRVPFNISLPTQTQGAGVGWVGQTSPKKVTELKFGQITLGMTKAAGIVALSEELVRASSPSAEAVVRADLIAAMAQFLDQQFVDPEVGEVANVSPASITNGITPIVASGTTADKFRTDVENLFGNFITANQSLSSGHWIMDGATALALSLMRNALDQDEFPQLTPLGGTLLGFPVVVSNNVVADSGTGSPGTPGSRIIFVNASDILVADDGQTMIDVSREASIQLNDAPSAGAQSLVSLWQNNLVGIRAERFINWKRRRDTAVGYIRSANYTSGT